MRLWPRRRPPATNQAGVLRDPRIHLAPIEIRHELRHVYEPRPTPDRVEIHLEGGLSEVGGGQLWRFDWWPAHLEHTMELPVALTGPEHLVRLRLIPHFERRYG